MENGQPKRAWAGLGSVVACCILSGCAFVPHEVEVVEPAPVAAAPPPPVAAPAPTPAPEQRREARPRPATPLRTAVLLSDDIPAFAAIAQQIELKANDEHLSIHNLDGNPANISTIKAEAADADQIIAIGLLAASVGQQISSKRMVFCQVFNYRDHDLLSASSKGVNLLPPFDMQLQHWTDLAPGLKSIGIITGPNQDDLIAEIESATQQRNIELVVRSVSSDKEALYAFKRLTPEIQGLWLLPDNRILSPEVVREFMSYSARHRKQVVVFGANLLGMGALMSVSSDAADVAEQVLARLETLSADGKLAGPSMRPLTKIQVQINPDVARHLDLEIPQTLASASSRAE